MKLHLEVESEKVRRTPILGVARTHSHDGVGRQGNEDLAEDFLEAWSCNSGKKGVAEATVFLFEAIFGTLERPILHKVVGGVWALLGSADLGDIRK